MSPNAQRGVPKTSVRKPVGHQVHDKGNLVSSLPSGQRRSGRSSARGEMAHVVPALGQVGGVVGDDDDVQQQQMGRGSLLGGAGGEEGGLMLQGMMSKFERGGEMESMMMSSAPVSERRSPLEEQRRRGMAHLRGDDDDSDDEEEDLAAYMTEIADEAQAWQVNNALNNTMYNLWENRDDDGYDSDADLEPGVKPGDPDWIDLDNHEHVRKNAEGEYVFDIEAQDMEDMKRICVENDYELDEPRYADKDENEDPVTQTFEWKYYFRDIMDLNNPLLFKPSKPMSNAVLPLKKHGPELDDFLYAATNHASKYSRVESKAKHADSRREPRPTFPRERTLPDAEFVDRYKGYLFVTGLVPHLDDSTGEVKDIDEVTHRQTVEEEVAKLFEGVKSVDVWPATSTSAYVGFKTKLNAKKAMIDSAKKGLLRVVHEVALRRYKCKQEGSISEEKEKFVAASPMGVESILKVTGLPENITSAELLQSMFPPGSKIDALFGPLTKDDYHRASSTTALINLASADLVSKALKSRNIASNASEVGKRSIQVLRAKRERVFAGWIGTHRTFAGSKLGARLIVTGDVPPNDMFLSHHDMLHISGLPSDVTLDDLAVFFQPFSADRRDVYGSGHIVRCSQGMPTGSAYVGFELPGEIEKVKEMYKDGKATIGGAEVLFRPVRDKLLRRGVRSQVRPSRTAEELRRDLRDWERHVDPKDIQYLEDNGIEKGVLDEIMITLRHHNRTFAASDQAVSGEKLYQERKTGHHYRDMVRHYIRELKSCIGTKEDPGLLYWGMHYPDQEIDLRIFEEEENRIKELRKKGV